jgi:hypothetical protein
MHSYYLHIIIICLMAFPTIPLNQLYMEMIMSQIISYHIISSHMRSSQATITQRCNDSLSIDLIASISTIKIIIDHSFTADIAYSPYPRLSLHVMPLPASSHLPNYLHCLITVLMIYYECFSSICTISPFLPSLSMPYYSHATNSSFPPSIHPCRPFVPTQL